MSLPFRADHVGSLLRPAELLDARRSHISPEEIHALEDRQILRILQRQKELGLEIFTDGELRRTNFMSDITEAVEGFDLGDAVQRSWIDDAKAAPQPAAVSSITGIVTSTLKQRQPFTGRELPFLTGTRARSDQDYVAQCDTVSGHLVQVRHHRCRISRSLRAAHCDHGAHGGGPANACR